MRPSLHWASPSRHCRLGFRCLNYGLLVPSSSYPSPLNFVWSRLLSPSPQYCVSLHRPSTEMSNLVVFVVSFVVLILKMDNEGANFRIEKLTNSKFHIWKQKVQLILYFCDLGDHVWYSICTPSDGENAAESWSKSDAKEFKAVIELSWSDNNLEHVHDCETALIFE